MLIPYFSDIAFDPAMPMKAVALVHPGGSQTGSLHFRRFDVIGQSNALVHFRLSRHPSMAIGGTTNTAQSFLDGAPASYAQVLSGSPTWPVDLANLSIIVDTMTQAAHGVVPTNNASSGAMTIAPEHSLIIESLDADIRGAYTIRVFWGDQRSALPHIASTTLSAAGVFTTTTYFNVPEGWTHITFFVTYTAHVDATPGGKPNWRCSASDGANDFQILIAKDVLDLSALPVANRTVYRLEDTWSEHVEAGQTIRFTVSYHVPPGTTRIRLDISEIGDTTNPGIASATITGM